MCCIANNRVYVPSRNVAIEKKIELTSFVTRNLFRTAPCSNNTAQGTARLIATQRLPYTL